MVDPLIERKSPQLQRFLRRFWTLYYVTVTMLMLINKMRMLAC
jgi:hypothetical protein